MKVNIAKILGKRKKGHLLILAGDIGGTKTTLGYFMLKGEYSYILKNLHFFKRALSGF